MIMRIAVDIRALLGRNRAGVSLYTLQLVQRLTERGAHDYALFCNSSRLPLPTDAPVGPNVSQHFKHYPNRLLNGLFAFLNRPRIESLVGGADLVYLPNLNFIATNRPLVITVHDLSFRRYPHFFSNKQKLWHKLINIEKMIKKAEAVVAVSEHTKDDLLESFNIPAERVHIVTPAADRKYHPCTEKEIAIIRQKYNLPAEFILYLGTLEPRKNVVGLIAAFNQIKTGADLVLAGGKGWLYQHIYQAAKQSPKNKKIKFLDYIDEKDKPAVYSAATIFAYPSFYEGFGMPALEAMACGTPVVASNTSSLGGVVADAGLLVNPAQQNEIAAALDELLTNQTLHSELSARGLKQASRFSWDKSATDLEKVFSISY
jgi:glycosyltransferase involved in cell wall biosynthesis